MGDLLGLLVCSVAAGELQAEHEARATGAPVAERTLDEDGYIEQGSHPFARQLKLDIQAMVGLGGGGVRPAVDGVGRPDLRALHRRGGAEGLLYDGCARVDHCCAVPPEGMVDALPAEHAADDEDGKRMLQCDRVTAGAAVCGSTRWRTRRQLLSHQLHVEGGGHARHCLLQAIMCE